VIRLFFACDQDFCIAVSHIDKVIPVSLNIFWRTTFERNVEGNVLGRNHVDGIPRANLSTVLASNAPIKVDITPTLNRRKILAWHFVNALDRTDLDACFAACAAVSMNHSHDLRNDFSRLACQRLRGHVVSYLSSDRRINHE
jgi:hypothetical protein